MDKVEAPGSDPADIPWPVLVRFIRQLSHDLRNHLNAAELQTAYLGEIAADGEVKDEIKRLREMLTTFGSVLQKLSADMGHVRLNIISYKAADLIDDFRRRLESQSPERPLEIDWKVDVGDATLNLDPQLLPSALQEFIINAGRFGDGAKVTFEATRQKEYVVLRLTEPKEQFQGATQNWGREPLRNPGHGHYGLGLNRARIIVESHGGTLEAKYDPAAKTLVTEIQLPVSPGAA